MSQRNFLLGAVRARLEGVLSERDAEAVLSDEALAEVSALLSAVPDHFTDLEVLHVAGWFYWYRFRFLPPDASRQALNVALTFLTPLYETQPEALPNQSGPAAYSGR